MFYIWSFNLLQVKVWFQNRRMKWRHSKEAQTQKNKAQQTNCLIAGSLEAAQKDQESGCESEGTESEFDDGRQGWGRRFSQQFNKLIWVTMNIGGSHCFFLRHFNENIWIKPTNFVISEWDSINIHIPNTRTIERVSLSTTDLPSFAFLTTSVAYSPFNSLIVMIPFLDFIYNLKQQFGRHYHL